MAHPGICGAADRFRLYEPMEVSVDVDQRMRATHDIPSIGDGVLTTPRSALRCLAGSSPLAIPTHKAAVLVASEWDAAVKKQA